MADGDGDVVRWGWLGMDSRHVGMDGDGVKSDPGAAL